MADDIVTRLRTFTWLAEEGSEVVNLATTAADTIEHLTTTATALYTAVLELSIRWGNGVLHKPRPETQTRIDQAIHLYETLNKP